MKDFRKIYTNKKIFQIKIPKIYIYLKIYISKKNCFKKKSQKYIWENKRFNKIYIKCIFQKKKDFDKKDLNKKIKNIYFRNRLKRLFKKR